MSDVLTIVGTRAQAAMISRVLGCLSASGHGSWKAVSLDTYYRESGTADWLKRNRVPFTTLGPAKYPLLRAGFRFGSNWHRLSLVLEARRYIRDLLDREHPRVIVFGSDVSPVEKLLIRAAQKRGVPTLLVQDGILSRHEHTDHGPKPTSVQGWMKRCFRSIIRLALDRVGLLPGPTNFGLSGCTRIAVMGSVAREILIERGVSAEQIVITGQPRYDFLVQSQSSNEREVRDSLGLDQGTQLILYASFLLGRSRYGSPKDDETVLRCLVDLARWLDGRYSIVIRPHPLDPIEDYRAHLRRIGGADATRVVKEFDTISLIRASSLLITFGSTVAYEAIIFRKPLITLNLTRLPDYLDLAKEGAAVAVHSPETLVNAVQSILFDASFREQLIARGQSVIESHLYKLDAHAGDRVAAEIIALMQGQQSA